MNRVGGQLDFLAANVRVNSGPTTTSASVNCLSDNLDDAFELFMRMVREPGFDSDRLEVVRGQTLEGLKQRDDQGFGIAMRETRMALYGDEHFGWNDFDKNDPDTLYNQTSGIVGTRFLSLKREAEAKSAAPEVRGSSSFGMSLGLN